MEDYKRWLREDRIQREITYQLRMGFNKMKQPNFSYLRVQGLQHLLQFLKQVEDESVLFGRLQDGEELNVIWHVYHSILKPEGNDVNVSSPVTSEEKRIALEIIQSAVGYHANSKSIFPGGLKGFELLLSYLADATLAENVHVAATNLLMQLLTDSPENLKTFEGLNGWQKIANRMQDQKLGMNARCACSELALHAVRYFKAHEVFVKALGMESVKELLKGADIHFIDYLDSESSSTPTGSDTK